MPLDTGMCPQSLPRDLRRLGVVFLGARLQSSL